MKAALKLYICAMLWEEYLVSKKINSSHFKKNEAELWASWKSLFEQMYPNSFTAQKLYLINPVRRKYPLQESEVVVEEPVKKAIVKPKLTKPKMTKPKPVIRKPKID